MATAFVSQDKHLVRMSTVLPEGVLIANRLNYTETMSDGFSLSLDSFSEKRHDIQKKELIGTSVTASLVATDNTLRYFNGLIESVSATPSTTRNNYSQYKITVVSWFHLLTARRTNYRIFQDKSVLDVIKAVLDDYGTTANYEIRRKRTYLPWRYLCQYNETDFNFITRLCRLEGITYFFEHENGQHQLILVDDPGLIKDLSPKIIEVQPNTHSKDSFHQWSSAGNFITGNFDQTSYNYIKPTTSLALSKTVSEPAASIPHVTDISSYIYSGDYTSSDEGKSILEARVNAEQGKAKVWVGMGNVRHLRVGKNFSIVLPDGKTHPEEGEIFTLIKVNIEADDTAGVLSSDVQALLAGNLIYPEATQEKVHSLQTAIVVGKSGQEIQTDLHGRVKVRFHWDRSGLIDGQNTCYLRVMQSFASAGFGAQFTPRVGDEVVVAFENGNPDRPFVLGSLYNQENSPPYADFDGLRSGIRTRSSKGGKPDNCNELYFHDEKGKEEVYFQAEKDFKSHVKNNSAEKIDNNKHIHVAKDEQHRVDQNLSTRIGKVMFTQAGDELILKVGGSVIKMTGNRIDISSGEVVINGKKIELN